VFALVIGATMARVAKIPTGVDWIAASDRPLPVVEILACAVQPNCGAIVTFSGTVRAHSEGRAGLVSLECEACLEQVEPSLAVVASATRARWSAVDRLALLSRVGRLEAAEVSVVVIVPTPHRADAFQAAGDCTDTIKTSVPIWKREAWGEGSGWALWPRHMVDADPAHDGADVRLFASLPARP
jgi:molybdopterin synthase catalytic subunit